MKKLFTLVAAALVAANMFAADNLFDAATTTLTTWFSAPGDSWPEETESTGSYDAATGTVTVDIAIAKAGQWRAQVKLNTTGIALDATKNYEFKCSFNSTNALNNVTVKIFDDSELSLISNLALVAGNTEYSSKPFAGGNVGNGVIVFDFGYAQVGDHIVISNIVLQESEAEVLPDPKPEAAPAVPTLDADSVLSIYSNTYTAAKPFGFCEGWGQSTGLEELNFDGNTVLYYKRFNYLGWACQAGAVDASAYGKLHLDIWAPAAASIDVYPIYGDGIPEHTNDKVFKTVVLAEGWNAVDLNTADFAGLDFSSIFQFKFAKQTDSELEFFALDNVYFYGVAEKTALQNNEAEANIVKTLRNGQVVIIRNGVEYNALGQQIR